MKIIKIAKKNNSTNELFLKDSKGIKFNNNEETIIKQRIEDSINTHINLLITTDKQINKTIIKKNIKLFFKNEITLKQFLKSLNNQDLNHYLELNKLDYKLSKNSKEIKNIFWTIRKVLGKNFLLTVGDIFAHKNLTYEKIMQKENSYYQQLIKSLKNNKVKTESLIFDVNKYKCVFELTDEFKKECKNKIEKNWKVNKNFDKETIILISNIIFKSYESFVYKNIKNIPNEDDKKLYRKHKIRLLNIVGKDLKFKINKLNEENFKNNSEVVEKLIDWLKRLIEKKIQILSKPNYFNQKIKISKYINRTDDNLKENEKIAAHKIHNFYKNFSSVIGSSIFNYNKKYLNQNKEFIDFGDDLSIPKKKEKYTNLKFDKFLGINQVFAINTLRNTIMHIRDFNFENKSKYNEDNKKIFESNAKNLLEIQINELSKQYKKNIEIKFQNHKISQSKLDYIKFDNSLSLPKFKKIKYLLENISSLNKIKNHNLVKSFLISENQDIERYNSNQFYLIQLYENNFCTWLKNETIWKKSFKQKVLNNITSFQPKLTRVTFDEYLQSQSISEFIYKSGIWQTNKENEALKKKENIDKEIHSSNIILNIYLSLFDLYLNDIKYENIELDNSEKSLQINNIEIIKLEDIQTNWLWYFTFLNSFYNLSKYELAQLKNLFVKWQTRFIENDMFSLDKLKIKDEYKILFDKNFIQTNINLIYLLMDAKEKIIETKHNNENLNEDVKKLIDGSYENSNEYNNQNLELINYEYNFYPNIIKKFLEHNIKISSKKIDLPKNNKVLESKDWKLKQKLNEQSAQNRFTNGQTILDSLNLINELKYWLIKYAMYREYVLIDIIEEINTKNTKNTKKNLQTIITLFPNDLELIEKLIKKVKNPEHKNFLENKKEELEKRNLQNSGEIRDSLLHLNQLQDFFDGESQNNIQEWKKLVNILNDIRTMYNQDKHIKNSIIPSLKRLFQKYNLEIEFVLDNHIIQNMELKSKFYIDPSTKEAKYPLKSQEEIKVFKIALGDEITNEKI